jgi:hypothetical protein
VSEALGLPDDASGWVVLRDARSGLEYLRGCRDIARHGLELDLHAYQCHVFLDPSIVHDDPAGDWARLAWRIGLGGVPDVREALQDQLLEPTRIAVGELFTARTVRDLAGAALAASDRAAEVLVTQALEGIREPLAAVGKAIGATSGRGATLAAVREGAEIRIRGIVETVRAGRRAGAVGSGPAAVASWLGSDRSRWALLTSWAAGACLGDLVRASSPVAATGVFDAWAAGSAVARSAAELEIEEPTVERVVRITRALLAVPVGATSRLADGDDAADVALAGWLAIPAVAAATGWNEWQGVAYVAREPFEEWLGALGARDATSGIVDAPSLTAALAARAAARGYRAPVLGDAAAEAAPTRGRKAKAKRSES